MRFVIQRVLNAKTTIIETDDKGNKTERISGQIEKGYLVLCGILENDDMAVADKMVYKLLSMRIFEDENEKMNLSVEDTGGAILSISQFTLYADCRKGNRPSFVKSGSPEHAKELYLYFNEVLRSRGIPVEEGIFAADMKVRLLNDGPVTITMDSEEVLAGGSQRR
jgi:D-tyrosyl-tRNA(Tyr) deacylase